MSFQPLHFDTDRRKVDYPFQSLTLSITVRFRPTANKVTQQLFYYWQIQVQSRLIKSVKSHIVLVQSVKYYKSRISDRIDHTERRTLRTLIPLGQATRDF
jgi:hypothetical protein